MTPIRSRGPSVRPRPPAESRRPLTATVGVPVKDSDETWSRCTDPDLSAPVRWGDAAALVGISVSLMSQRPRPGEGARPSSGRVHACVSVPLVCQCQRPDECARPGAAAPPFRGGHPPPRGGLWRGHPLVPHPLHARAAAARKAPSLPAPPGCAFCPPPTHPPRVLPSPTTSSAASSPPHASILTRSGAKGRGGGRAGRGGASIGDVGRRPPALVPHVPHVPPRPTSPPPLPHH